MSYQFTSCQYSNKSGENKVKQEYFLQDIENQKYLVVSKEIESGEVEIFNANYDKEKTSKVPLHKLNGKGLNLNTILERAGITSKDIPAEATLVSHSPPFHADDLLACALMGKYFESKGIPHSIILTRDQKIIDSATAAVDVGGKHHEENLRFDHHQLKDSEKAATGLVADFLEKEKGFVWVSKFKPTLEKIDRADLGTPKAPQDLRLSEALGNFNPTWKEKQNNQFFEALEVVSNSLEESLASITYDPSKNISEIFEEALLKNSKIIHREKQVEEAKVEGNEQFISAAIKGRESGVAETQQGIDFYLLFTEEYLAIAPKEESKALKSINYITFKTPTGSVNAIAAPKPENRMEQKHPFPQEWRGKRGQELVDAISQSVGSTGGKFPPVPADKANEYFCHNAGFFFTAPDQAIFDTAIDYCATIAKEKENPKKEEKLKHRDRWGRGGIMGDI